MLSEFVGLVKRQRYLVGGVVIGAAIISVLCMGYRRYATAVIWHCMHGNQADVGGYKVSLPILWWKERAHAHNTSDMRNRDEWLARACLSSFFPEPEINVRRAIPGEVADTDAEDLKLMQRVISVLNQNPPKGWSHSLIVLNGPKFTFDCMQDHFTMDSVDLNKDLICNAPELPYTLHYNGPPEYEKEAEAILQNIQ